MDQNKWGLVDLYPARRTNPILPVIAEIQAPVVLPGITRWPHCRYGAGWPMTPREWGDDFVQDRHADLDPNADEAAREGAPMTGVRTAQTETGQRIVIDGNGLRHLLDNFGRCCWHSLGCRAGREGTADTRWPR
jgi:hypothetical protein